MKINFYAVYDKKARCYSLPFTAVNDEVAVRIIQSTMDNNSMLVQFSSDYRLDRIGEFLDENAALIDLDKKVIVSEMSNLVVLPFTTGDDFNEREG